MYTKSYGAEVVDLAASVGLILDVNQCALVEDWFAVRPGTDEWSVTEGVVIAPRQNLKTVALEAVVLAKLFLFADPLITWSAHLYKTAQEAFRDVKGYIDNYDHLRRVVKSISTAKGDESVELASGERLQWLARTTHGGRGLSGDTLILDEALKLTDAHMASLVPTLSARRGAQLFYASSAGDAPAAILRTIRDRGRAGEPRMSYTEYAAPETDCGDGCTHWMDSPGCVYDREDLLRAANPALALPDRLQLDYIRETERRSLPPADFARERLGWWDDPPLANAIAFEAGVWERCADPSSSIPGKPVFGASMSPDRDLVSLVAAGRRADGHFHVEVILQGPPAAGFVADVAAITAKHSGTVVVHPAHAIGSVMPELETAKVRLKMISSAEYVQSCGGFFDAVLAGRLHYLPGETYLTDAVRRAVRKASGEAWRWDGNGITALVAASQALHVTRAAPIGGKGRVILLR